LACWSGLSQAVPVNLRRLQVKLWVRTSTRLQGIGFLKKAQRLNVAISRAQRLLIVVGDIETITASKVMICTSHCWTRSNGRVRWPDTGFNEVLVKSKENFCCNAMTYGRKRISFQVLPPVWIRLANERNPVVKGVMEPSIDDQALSPSKYFSGVQPHLIDESFGRNSLRKAAKS
jgi:hypothetical protein